MRRDLTLDLSKTAPFLKENELDYMEDLVKAAHEKIHNKTGAGNDFLGWVDLPINYDKAEFERIKAAAKKIQSDSEVLIVIGIGGSYLGARAAIEMLSHSFHSALDASKRKTPQIFFVGNNISSTYMADLLEVIEGKDVSVNVISKSGTTTEPAIAFRIPQIFFVGNNISSTYMADLLEVIEGKDVSVNVISKSGTTTEPAIAFRIFKAYLEKKYGKEEAKKRIFATTDKAKGALKSLADAEGYETFVVPDDVGGRFSVLTAVGLLPIAVAGISIDEMMQGAADAREKYS